MSSTSERHTEHPFAGQNTQQKGVYQHLGATLKCEAPDRWSKYTTMDKSLTTLVGHLSQEKQVTMQAK